MILLRGVVFHEVVDLFQPINDGLDTALDPHQIFNAHCNLLTVQDGWRAVHTARDNGWLDFPGNEAEGEGRIDTRMKEYLHYDNPANGRWHVVIPFKLIVFQCPTDLLTLQLLLKSDEPHERHFVQAFYAKILGMDYDVQLVVQCNAYYPVVSTSVAACNAVAC